MNDLGVRLNLKDISTQFISVAVAMDALVESICEMANKEVSETSTSMSLLGLPTTLEILFLIVVPVRLSSSAQHTIPRQHGPNQGMTDEVSLISSGFLTVNTIQTIELFMAWYGKPFLESSVGSVIRRICVERVSIEVDPSKTSTPTQDLDKNVDILVNWCQEMWDSIYRARSECPPEMRRLFEHVRKLVEKRCRATKTPVEDGSQSDLPWQAVSAFVFLRFIVPAILHPHSFGLVPGKLFFHLSSLTVMTLIIPGDLRSTGSVSKTKPHVNCQGPPEFC